MKLAAFAEEIVRGTWEGYGWDGADIQELAISHGLIVKTQYDPEKHGPNTKPNNEYLEPGDPYYIFSDEFKVALAETN